MVVLKLPDAIPLIVCELVVLKVRVPLAELNQTIISLPELLAALGKVQVAVVVTS